MNTLEFIFSNKLLQIIFLNIDPKIGLAIISLMMSYIFIYSIQKEKINQDLKYIFTLILTPLTYIFLILLSLLLLGLKNLYFSEKPLDANILIQFSTLIGYLLILYTLMYYLYHGKMPKIKNQFKKCKNKIIEKIKDERDTELKLFIIFIITYMIIRLLSMIIFNFYETSEGLFEISITMWILLILILEDEFKFLINIKNKKQIFVILIAIFLALSQIQIIKKTEIPIKIDINAKIVNNSLEVSQINITAKTTLKIYKILNSRNWISIKNEKYLVNCTKGIIQKNDKNTYCLLIFKKLPNNISFLTKYSFNFYKKHKIKFFSDEINFKESNQRYCFNSTTPLFWKMEIENLGSNFDIKTKINMEILQNNNSIIIYTLNSTKNFCISISN